MRTSGDLERFRLTDKKEAADVYELYIGIAGLNVRMICNFPYAQRLCADFSVEPCKADMTVSVTPEEIAQERDQYTETTFSDGYCEGICLYRAIAEQLPEHDGFVFHGAAVTIDGKGYVFAAPSGTGKTTHITLLLKNYPDHVGIVNGDKPVIRKIDGEWRVCSTPWAGKEGWKTNSTAPLAGIVLVERAEENSIAPVSPEENFDPIMRQVYIPKSAESCMATLSLVDEMSQSVRFYRLGCNMEPAAAKCSYDALSAQKW